MNDFNIDKIEAIVFMGFSPYIEKLFSICNKQGIKPFLITSPDQSKNLSANIKFKSFANLNEEFSDYIKNNFNASRTLFLSLGARWIFKQNIISEVLKNNLVNAHGSRLPFDSGGGGMSWRILKKDRICMHLIHLVDTGIDTGPIIFSKKSLFPKSCQIPEDFNQYYSEIFLLFLDEFLKLIKSNFKFKIFKQLDYIGNYYPRLSTDKNGFINWNWPSNELILFIDAFDNPYEGASTYINNKLVRLKSCQLHGGEENSHSFMSGLISRHDKDWIIINTTDSYYLIAEEVIDEKGKNIIKTLKVGDRFNTPYSVLENSLSTRVYFGPSGEK